MKNFRVSVVLALLFWINDSIQTTSESPLTLWTLGFSMRFDISEEIKDTIFGVIEEYVDDQIRLTWGIYTLLSVQYSFEEIGVNSAISRKLTQVKAKPYNFLEYELIATVQFDASNPFLPQTPEEFEIMTMTLKDSLASDPEMNIPLVTYFKESFTIVANPFQTTTPLPRTFWQLVFIISFNALPSWRETIDEAIVEIVDNQIRFSWSKYTLLSTDYLFTDSRKNNNPNVTLQVEVTVHFDASNLLLPQTIDELNLMSNELKDGLANNIRLHRLPDAIYNKDSFIIKTNYSETTETESTTESWATELTTTGETTRQTSPQFNDCSYTIQPPNYPATGIITSPNYPNDYPNNLRCEIILRSSNQKQLITITIRTLQTEACCDYLRILSSSQEVLFQGHSLNNDTIAGYAPLTFFFYTDHSVVDKGFLLTYEYIDINDSVPTWQLVVSMSFNALPNWRVTVRDEIEKIVDMAILVEWKRYSLRHTHYVFSNISNDNNRNVTLKLEIAVTFDATNRLLPQTLNNLDSMSYSLRSALTYSWRLGELSNATYLKDSFTVLADLLRCTVPREREEYKVIFAIKLKVSNHSLWNNVKLRIEQALLKEVKAIWTNYGLLCVSISFTEVLPQLSTVNRQRRMIMKAAEDMIEPTDAPTLTLEATVNTTFPSRTNFPFTPLRKEQYDMMIKQMEDSLSKNTSDINNIDNVSYQNDSFEVKQGLIFEEGPELKVFHVVNWIIFGLVLGGVLMIVAIIICVACYCKKGRK